MDIILYIAMKFLSKDDKQFVWHPYTQMKDWDQNNDNKVIVKGDGFYLIDSDGNKYSRWNCKYVV